MLIPNLAKQNQKTKMEHYLQNKYAEEMVIKNINYEFLHNRYWAMAYPVKYPEISFSVNQKPGDRYTDTFLQEYWLYQSQQDFQPVIAELFPEDTRFGVQYIHNVPSLQGEIPDYITAKVPISLVISVPAGFSEKGEEAELETLFRLIETIRSKKAKVTLISVTYLEEKRMGSIYFNIPDKAIEEVQRPEDLRQWMGINSPKQK